MGERDDVLDLWKQYVHEGMTPDDPLPPPEHVVIKEGSQGEERTGLYYSVFNQTAGQLEYHLLILPENELARATNAFPTVLRTRRAATAARLPPALSPATAKRVGSPPIAAPCSAAQ